MISASKTPIRYALVSGLGLYHAPMGDTPNPRHAYVAYTRECATLRANGLTGYDVVPVRIGHYRCYQCSGAGEWQIGPDDWDSCYACEGHGWIERRKK